MTEYIVTLVITEDILVRADSPEKALERAEAISRHGRDNRKVVAVNATPVKPVKVQKGEA